MATETSLVSPAPWDLASGNKWTVHGDRKIDGDHNNEVIVDAKGAVVAYVSGFNDEGGNGSLLAAAPALRDALSDLFSAIQNPDLYLEGASTVTRPLRIAIDAARAALKKAGAL